MSMLKQHGKKRQGNELYDKRHSKRHQLGSYLEIYCSFPFRRVIYSCIARRKNYLEGRGVAQG
jgi:hypothetical protein